MLGLSLRANEEPLGLMTWGHDGRLLGVDQQKIATIK